MRRCPVCGKEYAGHPALSRRDNRTEICQTCGIIEALQDFGMDDSKIEEVIKLMPQA